MPRLALILGLFLFPAAAMAAPLPVISGEHDGYTRIVAQVPNGRSWEVVHTGQTVTLTLTGPADGFDTTAVFDRIARNRIAELKGEATSLVLTLDCACQISAFPSGQDYAVIDVADPGVALPTPLLVPTPQQPLDAEATLDPAPDRVAEQTPVPALLPVIVKTPQPKQPPPLLNLDRVALTEAQQAALSEIQGQLAEELSAATTRGLLDPSVKRQLPPRPQIDPAGLDIALPPAPPPAAETSDALSNMRISSSMDMPFGASPSGAGTTRTGLSCPDNGEIAVETWGEPDAFEQQISAGRAALFGEFDRIDPQAVLDLTRSYLYFGFGAEARQVLSLAPELTQSNRLLFDLADIMDHGSPRWPEALQAFAECSSDIALWAILAQDDTNVTAALPVGTALRTLNKLPAHLRRFLAPHLSRQLLARGYDEAAATALRSLERLPERLPTEATLAQAHVALKKGNIDTGTAKLESVVEKDTEQSPGALIALIETRLKADQPISIETADLVETYAQEHRGTPLGAELQRAHVMSLIKSGQFDLAIKKIEALGSLAETDEALALRLNLVRELTTSATDIVFLDHILSQPMGDITLLHETDKFDLAARLLSLGFAADAQRILATEPEASRPPRRQLLAAEAALALDQPFQAQAALLGVEDPAAAPLRARAKAMTGAFDEADELFRQSNLPGPARDAAWLAEDWRERTPAEAPVFGPVALLAESRLQLSDDPNGMLARTVEALTESAAARDTLADLLSATALPQAESE